MHLALIWILDMRIYPDIQKLVLIKLKWLGLSYFQKLHVYQSLHFFLILLKIFTPKIILAMFHLGAHSSLSQSFQSSCQRGIFYTEKTGVAYVRVLQLAHPFYKLVFQLYFCG